jgi:hypothetical protein
MSIRRKVSEGGLSTRVCVGDDMLGKRWGRWRGGGVEGVSSRVRAGRGKR